MSKTFVSLSADERAHFAAKGWAGPFPLLTPAEAHAIDAVAIAHARDFTYPNEFGAPDLFARRPWFKSMHAYLPEVFDLSRDPALAGRIAAIAGPDLVAWGVTMIAKRPGERHPWHIDIETASWPGVSAFLGLRNTGASATLDVISGSHRLKRFPFAVSWASNEEALAAVQAEDPSCTLDRVPVAEGEFFLFHGRLLHGSCNEGTTDRHAMILQYSPASARIAIPLTFQPPVKWHPMPPPVVRALGNRGGPNRVIEAPLPLPAREG